VTEFTLISAFIVGLLGGVHCVGMCGGIVGALTLGLADEARSRPGTVLPYLLAYNGGRVLSYTAAGALMGGVGLLAANLAAVHQAQQALQIVAGTFMVVLGLYLGGWWLGLARLERVGGRLWPRIEPLGRRLLPVRSRSGAFALGLVWGWLPCGLVYSVLIWSIAAGGFLEGGLLMLSFGLGTLPALLAMGVVASQLAAIVRRTWVRRVAGALVIAFGAYTLRLAVG
jgi:uncharacterized protein